MLRMTDNDLGRGERDPTARSVVIVVSCCQLITCDAGMLCTLHVIQVLSSCDTDTHVTCDARILFTCNSSIM